MTFCKSYSSQILCAILAILSHKEQVWNKRLLGLKKKVVEGLGWSQYEEKIRKISFRIFPVKYDRDALTTIDGENMSKNIF